MRKTIADELGIALFIAGTLSPRIGLFNVDLIRVQCEEGRRRVLLVREVTDLAVRLIGLEVSPDVLRILPRLSACVIDRSIDQYQKGSMKERTQLTSSSSSSVVTLDVLGGHVPIPAEELSVLLLYLAGEYRTPCEIRETCVAEHFCLPVAAAFVGFS